MKIAEIAPLIESVPPKFYGGTERVVAYLSEEMVKLGHEVTVFGSGDSITSANLISLCPSALRGEESVKDYVPYNILIQEKVFQTFKEFDIIHSHLDYFLFPLLRHLNVPAVTTLHGRLDLPDLIPIYNEFRDIKLISISNNQRKPFLKNNWLSTIYHGIPKNMYTYNANPKEYLAFLGRVSPEKGIEEAIKIAKIAGVKLKISSKIDKADKDYFETRVKPLLNHPLIEFTEEITEKEKNDLLGQASALLFPINWCEPFGLVMIEALACGTPVIAYNCGSTPEVIEHNVTGFICKNMQEAITAIKNISSLSRKRCRQVFEEKYTSQRMASDYLRIFEKIHEK